jgi:hypothetical protein
MSAGGRGAGSQSAECRKGCEAVRATGDAKNQKAAAREWAESRTPCLCEIGLPRSKVPRRSRP